MLALLAEAPSEIRADGLGDDVHGVIGCARLLGARVTASRDRVRVEPPRHAWRSHVTLDAGNSATAARLLMAVAAGRPGFEATITGNATLLRRPMGWVIEPLREMGATIEECDHVGRLPVRVSGRLLRGARLTPTVVSAQAKSALLFAGLQATGATTVVQPFATRDHTQRLFRHAGIHVEDSAGSTTLVAPPAVRGISIHVRGDISAAAPLLALAVVGPWSGARVRIVDVGLNECRTGFVIALRAMGADVREVAARPEWGEPFGAVVARAGRPLRGVHVSGGQLVQSMIDEVPLLCAVAAFADGETRIDDCAELRDKDTDRLVSVVAALRAFGADVRADGASLIVRGTPGRLRPAMVAHTGDHRIAMAASVMAAALPQPSTIRGAGVVSVSYPGFFEDLATLTHVSSG